VSGAVTAVVGHAGHRADQRDGLVRVALQLVREGRPFRPELPVGAQRGERGRGGAVDRLLAHLDRGEAVGGVRGAVLQRRGCMRLLRNGAAPAQP
jgi:hypothetical protein